MRIALHSPYFPKHFGGGEKYLLDTARVLNRYGSVEMAIAGSLLTDERAQEIRQQYEAFMGEKLDFLKFSASPLGTSAGVWEKLRWTRQFDLLYYVTDGSVFASLAKKNVMHIQTPLKRRPLSLIEQLKSITWQFVNTNSQFTKQTVEHYWRLPVNAVHQPMVDVVHLESLAAKTNKEPVVLHVGRFFRQLHSKRQDVLVDFFTQLREQYPKESKGWKLVLIGSVEDQAYAQEVRQQAKGLPIEIIHDISRKELDQWYAKASIYWHATGYDISEADHPEKMEHFGISTVEAMAAGAVPVVINKGGQPEVLGGELAELLWDDKAACLAKTAELMNNTTKRQALAQEAQVRSQQFSPEQFENNIRHMMQSLKLV